MATLADQWSADTAPSMEGLNPQLADAVSKAQAAYKAQYGKDLPITSAMRTKEQQAALASKPNKYPVAAPGTSAHETGGAIDISSEVPDSFLKQFGLQRPLGAKDPVHTTLMPQTQGGSTLADLWGQPDTEAPKEQAKVGKPESNETVGNVLQQAFELKKKIPGFVASVGDVVAGAPSMIAGTVGYGAGRLFGLSPEEATQSSQRVAGQLANPVSRLMGVQETEGYKKALPTQVMEYIGENINEGAKSIASKFGVPVADVQNAINAALIATPGFAKGMSKVTKPYMEELQIVKTNKATPKSSLVNAGAAATTDQATLNASIAQASPESKVQLQNLKPEQINKEALDRQLQADTLPVPIKLTSGQARQDPNLISKERNERGFKEQFVDRFNEQNKQLAENANEIKNITAPDVYAPNHVGNASEAIDILQGKIKNNNDAISNAYKELDNLGAGKIQVDSQTFANEAMKALSEKDDIDFLPKEFKDKLKAYEEGKPMNFNQFEHLRTQIATAARGPSVDGNVVHALTLLRSELEKLPLVNETAEAKIVADKARSLAKNEFDLLDKNRPTYNPLYAKVANGAADTKNFIQEFVLGSKNKDFDKSLAIIQDDPIAVQHLKAGAMDWIIRDSTDASGNFSTAKFNKHMQNLDVNGKLTKLFGEDAETIRKLVNTGRHIEARPRGAYVNESNTGVGLAAMAKEHGPALLEKIPGVKYVAAPVNFAREYIAKKETQKEINESLKPMAGVKLSDIAKGKQ
jgi:hypothetical protein